MPIRPAPVQYRCPACHWSKTVAPRGDALGSGAFFSACPACGHASLEAKPAGSLAGELAQVLESVRRLWK